MPTFTYGQNKQADQLVEKIVREDVLGCETALVNYVLGQDDPEAPFSREDVENMYPDIDQWPIPKCLEHLRENMTHVDFDDWSADIASTAIMEFGIANPDHGLDIPTDSLSALVEFFNNNNDLELSGELCDAIRIKTEEYVYDAEVYEWWRVAGWLADHLYELGEVVIRNGWTQYWGRQATGQSICLDMTMYEVIDRMEFKPEPEDDSPNGKLEELNAWQLKQIVRPILETMYRDNEGNWNPNNEVSGGDLVETVGGVFDRFGLVPKEGN